MDNANNWQEYTTGSTKKDLLQVSRYHIDCSIESVETRLLKMGFSVEHHGARHWMLKKPGEPFEAHFYSCSELQEFLRGRAKRYIKFNEFKPSKHEIPGER